MYFEWVSSLPTCRHFFYSFILRGICKLCAERINALSYMKLNIIMWASTYYYTTLPCNVPGLVVTSTEIKGSTVTRACPDASELSVVCSGANYDHLVINCGQLLVNRCINYYIQNILKNNIIVMWHLLQSSSIYYHLYLVLMFFFVKLQIHVIMDQ